MDFVERLKVRENARKLTKEKRKQLEEDLCKRKQEGEKQLKELKERGKFASDYRVMVEVDGKQVDITQPIFRQEKEFYPFGDIKFLQRSNEIKELLKTKQDEVYGLTYLETEGRFCDCPRYDPLFEDIKVYKKDYTNRTNVDEYVKEHDSVSCRDQQLFAAHTARAYDFGYKCFDDYLDPRYKYNSSSLVNAAKPSAILKCDVDGCCFKCHEKSVMEDHRARHGNEDFKYKCKSKHCLHRCATMAEFKRHMLSHCKHIFPCLYNGCTSVFSQPVEDSKHYWNHTKKEAFVSKFITGRTLCYVCRKMVRGFGRHKKQHPELLMKCPYPGCKAKFSRSVYWLSHRDSHMIDVLRKRFEENKFTVCYIIINQDNWQPSPYSASQSTGVVSIHYPISLLKCIPTATLSIF